MAEAKPTEKELTEIQRSHEAKALLEHPMIQGAMQAIELEWERKWKQTQPEDIKTREFAYRMLYSARKFNQLLTKIVDSGNMAEIQRTVRENQAELLERD